MGTEASKDKGTMMKGMERKRCWVHRGAARRAAACGGDAVFRATGKAYGFSHGPVNRIQPAIAPRVFSAFIGVHPRFHGLARPFSYPMHPMHPS
jgi:hypothetical protein